MSLRAEFPTRIRVQQYRCFQEEQTLLLRPLTLVFGQNNAGKSALLRLIRLLDASTAKMTRDGSLLRVLEPPRGGGSLENLLPRGSDGPFTITFEWESSTQFWSTSDDGKQDDL